MSARLVQVPMEEELRQRLDAVAQTEGKSRAVIIRKACEEYLRRVQQEQWDRQYLEGYRRDPERPEETEGLGVGAAQVWDQEFGDTEVWETAYQEWVARNPEVGETRK